MTLFPLVQSAIGKATYYHATCPSVEVVRQHAEEFEKLLRQLERAAHSEDSSKAKKLTGIVLKSYSAKLTSLVLSHHGELSMLITGCAEQLYAEPSDRRNTLMMQEVLEDAFLQSYGSPGQEIQEEKDYFPANMRSIYRAQAVGNSGEQAFLHNLGLKLAETSLTRETILSSFSKEAGCSELPVGNNIVLCRFRATDLWLEPSGINSAPIRKVNALYVANALVFFEFESLSPSAGLKRFTAEYGGDMESVGQDCVVKAWPIEQAQKSGEQQ